MKRPRIGINLDYQSEEQGLLDRHIIRTGYVHAVIAAGGLPVLIPSTGDESLVRDYLAWLDGIVLTGGADYPPESYGVETAHPETKPLPPERTRADLLLGRLLFSESRLPVLGICLGHELIHIAHGGRLIQHLPTAETHKSFRPGRDRQHPAQITAPGRLREIFGTDRLQVNSAHHQSIDPDSLPAGLLPVAQAEDGVIEAIEGQDPSRFVLGVQWHPERIQDDEHRRCLFVAFLEQCGQT